jgi:alpha-D-xyloside xylohydrolase
MTTPRFLRCFFCVFTLVSISTAWAAPYTQTAQGVKATVGNLDVTVDFYGPNLVRIIKTQAGQSVEKTSLSVTKQPEKTRVNLKQKGNELLLSSPTLHVSLDLNSGRLAFKTAGGKLLLTEKAAGAAFTPFNDAGDQTLSASQSFQLDKDEAIYGLGILQNGQMNQRNQEVRMVQNNTWDFVTFFQSVKGYGLFWDNYSPTTFKDNAEGTSFTSEVAPCIDYYVMYGGNADGVVAQMRDLTGQVPLFPLWTYGFWQSKERYKSQSEIVDVVKKYRELGIPLDGIIQDWQYWGNNYLWNAMAFLNEEFPQPQRMVDDIHALNAKLTISIWSSFGPATKQYRELEKLGALLNISTWPESGLTAWPPNMDYPSGVRVYDPFNPKARDIYWKYLNEGLFKLGMDGWWMDSTEPDHLSFKPEDMNNKTHLGSFRKVRNAYPLMTVGGVYDNQRATTNDKRVFILTRSGFAGQQRYGASVWSGDVNSSWDMLRKQVPAGLNFSLCGLPHWNSDIGGFFAGTYNQPWNGLRGAKNPLFQELYVRWMQFGAFTPMMRSHGTDIPREIYQFGQKGEPIYDAIEKTIRLRYALLPYIYATSWEVTQHQSSFMRALFMDFANDKNVLDMNDQFMFGKSILVAPVLKAQYTPERMVRTNENDGWNKNQGNQQGGSGRIDFTATHSTEVYLPAGTIWHDFWTNERHQGGQKITKETSIDLIPLYIRAGSILPLGPAVQYVGEKNWESLDIRIYPGADGSFTLYEDEGDNYNYEKGQYSTITFTWNNKQRTLTISDRQGTFKGMLPQRTFNLYLATPNQPGGDKTSGPALKTLRYTGKKTSLQL